MLRTYIPDKEAPFDFQGGGGLEIFRGGGGWSFFLINNFGRTSREINVLLQELSI